MPGRTEITASSSLNDNPVLRNADYDWALRNSGCKLGSRNSGCRSDCRLVEQLCNHCWPWDLYMYWNRRIDIIAALAGLALETGLSQRIGCLQLIEVFQFLCSKS